MTTDAPVLSVQYDHAFERGPSLDIGFQAGREITALFGPSGSGKTTTLAVIAGLFTPRAGSVIINQRLVFNHHSRVNEPSERRSVAVVFQDHLLFPHLTVEQNLRYGVVRPGRRNVDADRVIQTLQLSSMLDRFPRTLSGGEQQRVALGRAVLSGPEVLLMDEPVASLDEPLAQRVLSDVAALAASLEMTVVFVSHDQQDVRRFADRVVVIERGRVIASGPTGATLDAVAGASPSVAGSIVSVIAVSSPQRVGLHWEVRVGSGGSGEAPSLYLPGSLDAAPDRFHVSISPSDVILARDRVAGVSVRNQLAGRVVGLVEQPSAGGSGGVLVSVDIGGGATLWSEVTSEAARELGLGVGSGVTCLIKANAVRVLRL